MCVCGKGGGGLAYLIAATLDGPARVQERAEGLMRCKEMHQVNGFPVKLRPLEGHLAQDIVSKELLAKSNKGAKAAGHKSGAPLV